MSRDTGVAKDGTVHLSNCPRLWGYRNCTCPAPDRPSATDEQIRQWAERHGLDGVLNLTDARAAFEDAESLVASTKGGV